MIDTATPMPNSTNRAKRPWIEYGAALWALIFAVLHVVWAMGWYIGLDADAARKAFERGWFLAYDLIAAGLCLLGVGLALALIQSWGRRLPRSLISVLAWGCAGILALRAGASVIHLAFLAAAGNNVWSVLSFWDAWFCLGAILFAVSVWRFWRQSVYFIDANRLKLRK